jgi:flagellar biosynthetic protein FlhB
MAEETGQEKSEEPTAKKLEDSKKKGQIARSRELNTVVMLLSGATGLLILGDNIAESLWNLMEEQFSLGRADIFDDKAIVGHFDLALTGALTTVAPFMMLMLVAAFVGPIFMGGWSFSMESMAPKLEKLNPMKGLGRIFAVRGLVELVKALLKFILVAGATVLLFNHYINDFLGLTGEGLEKAIPHVAGIVMLAFLLLSTSLILVVAVDVPFQLWDHKKKLKMTLQEVKDEMKETDGRPEVKSKIRSIQMEMAQGRMMEEVPKADVIVTNPTHYAVALKYDQDGGGAPRVVAKGTELVAAQIRNLGTNAGVTLVAAPPLARALYYSTKLDQEIPGGLYLAVAQVLAYVYQVESAVKRGAEMPTPPSDFEIPEEYAR